MFVSDRSTLLVVVLFFSAAILTLTVSGEENSGGGGLSVVENEETVNHVVKPTVIKSDKPFEVDPGDEFVATTEWQTVKENQAIPKGLHVRLNMQTGTREAKLLDPRDNNQNKNKKSEKLPALSQQQEARKEEKKEEKPILGEKRAHLSKEMEESLKRLNDAKRSESTDDDRSEETKLYEEQIKKKFRSYDELRSELKEMELNVKSEPEILASLIKQFNTTNSKEEHSAILDDLEYHVHKYENGILLCDLNGFSMLTKFLNTSRDTDLNKKAITVLGSAIQGNPKVKLHAIKSEFLQFLLNKLSSGSHENENEEDWKKKLLFTLSGLLRDFPLAQKQFLRFGGVNVLSDLVSSRSRNTSVKVKLRAVSLANDLIQEKINVLASESQMAKLVRPQYEEINLIEELTTTARSSPSQSSSSGWCSSFEWLVCNVPDSHDAREKLFSSMLTLGKYCAQTWITSATKQKTEVVKKLVDFEQMYTKKHETESKNDENTVDDYFFRQTSVIKELLSIFRQQHSQEL